MLAGSFVSFSDRVLMLLQGEFPDFRFERVSEPPCGGAGPGQVPHLLICEEAAANRALDLVELGWANVAVAFDEEQAVAARLAASGLRELPEGLSLLPMNVRLDAWLSIVRLLLHGGSYVPVSVFRWISALRDGPVPVPSPPSPPGAPEPAGPLAGAPAAPPLGDPTLRTLTDRERKVLPLVAQGKQNKVIASELAMSEHTVKVHVHHIIGKLGVRNRTEAAGRYLSQSAVAKAV